MRSGRPRQADLVLIGGKTGSGTAVGPHSARVILVGD
jgi:hypothetical protein